MNIRSNLSVVIASIGGDVLIRTIDALNSGSIVPDEIILVVPRSFASNIPAISSENFRYQLVDFKGQVAQRAYGFTLVKSDYVMQLDDDIQLDHTCVERLITGLKKLGTGHSVGPSIFYANTNESIYSMNNGIKAEILNLKAFLLSGVPWGTKRMGKISKIGSGFGYDPESTSAELNRTEWIAGGCTLHHKSSLIFKNYFPYAGKAYGEDLLHSVELTNSGVKLFNVKSAVCFIEKPVLNRETYSLRADYKVRLYLNELRSVGKFRVHIWYVMRCLWRFF